MENNEDIYLNDFILEEFIVEGKYLICKIYKKKK
jgi:hypothetical protein